jgi:hypothetical protein
MAGRPRLLRFVKKEATSARSGLKIPHRIERRFQRVLLATFQIRFHLSAIFVPARRSHFDPFGTEFM